MSTSLRSALHGAPGLNGATIVGLHGSVPSSSDEAHIVLNRRPLLVEYLTKASRKRRVEMKATYPDLVNHIEYVLAFLRHTKTADHYETTVTCCSDPHCKLGCRGAPIISSWYPDGPTVMPLPPVCTAV